MKVFAIILENNKVSEHGWNVLKQSSVAAKNQFEINKFNAIKPEQVDALFTSYGLNWTWPETSPTIDFTSGLTKIPYPTVDLRKRKACYLSHMELWKRCSMDNEPYLILEHDAVFIKRLPSVMSQDDKSIVGINDPRGATRKSQLYHEIIQQNKDKVVINVPRIDSDNIPQGLAGNSAYIITPNAAQDVINKITTYGVWPNDAYLCYQLFPYISVTTTYYTKVQRLPSTTTL